MQHPLLLLKCLVVNLLFCTFLLQEGTVSAQQAQSSLYYYFGDQKMALNESTDKLYVRVPQSAASLVKQRLQQQFDFNSEAFSETENLNFLIIELGSKDIHTVTAFIKTYLPQVEMVRPAIVANDGTEEVIDEWFYVKLKAGATKADLESILEKYHCTIDHPYEYNNRVYILKATAANGYDGVKMANLFYEEGIFEYAEPDFRPLQLLHNPPPPPNDPNYYLQWSHINDGTSSQYSGTLGADMDVDSAWTITQGDTAIRIAVLDEGVERTHPDLVNNIDPLGFGLVASVAATGSPLSTSRSHGTCVAGIIAAQANNGIGVAGIAPNCKIVPVNLTVNTSGTFGTAAQIALCIDWAWNTGAADVINNSWGGGTASSLMKDAIHSAVTLGRGGKGTVVLFSSGNNNSGVSSPAIFEEVISVGAMSMCYERKSTTSCDGENFWGGNYGVTLDISAPGVKIATTTTSAGYNNTFNGTSSACPNATGVVALMLSANDTLTEKRVREIIERTAKKVGGYNYYHMQGQPHGTWSSELGHGMINAYKAVQAAQNDTKYCPVAIDTPVTLQVCSGGTIALQVDNVDAAATYTWLQNGSLIPSASGASYNAASTGGYSVIVNKTGCADTSSVVKITVSSSTGTLLAFAGNDTTLVSGGKVILGGGPAASGGTPILHPMRGFVSNLSADQLIRFDPEQPASNYKIVKSGFMPNYNSSSTFFSAAAATPYGIYMAMRTDNYLAKIDTATGAVINIGSFGTFSNIGAMTYDPKTGKIFAIDESNDLYQINRLTGQATFINSIFISTLIVSLSADTAGVLYAVANRSSTALGSAVYTINKLTAAGTFIGYTGYNGSYAQDGAIDLLTNELYACPTASALNNSSYVGAGLWKLNKTTGAGTLVGSIALPFNQLDALAFVGPEYQYSWSPATGLSNPNDGNPQFVPTVPGKYTFTLTVTDLCGNTAQDSITITVCPSAFTPVSLTATNISDTSAKLGWTSISDSATVEYGLLGFTQGNGTIVNGINQNSYNLNGLSANTTYSFYVRAYCSGGTSTWAGPYTFTTQNAPLPLAGIVLAGYVKDKSAFLNWTAKNEMETVSYSLDKSQNSKDFISVYTTPAKANDKTDVVYEWIDNDFSGNNYYRITALSATRSRSYSNVIKLQSAGHSVAAISLFPNPVKDADMNIQFSNMAEGAYVMRIYNSLGALISNRRIIHTGGNKTYPISLDKELASGMYNLQIINVASGACNRLSFVAE